MSALKKPATSFDLVAGPLDGINLIEASAGTGKTWNICALYLRLLLERNLGVEKILVVTFTIAATAELRERIRARISEALAHIRHGAEADEFIVGLVQRLLDGDGNATAPRPTHETLAARLDLALQTFDEAAIFTIHGFCQRALADTAFAAGLPFDTELATDDNEIILEAVNDFWRRRVAADGFSPALASFMLDRKDTPLTLAKLVARHVAKPLAKSIWPEALDTPEHATVDIEKLEHAYDAARNAWLADRDAVIDCVTKGLPHLNKASYKEDSIAEAAAVWDRYFLKADPLAEPAKKHDLLTTTTLKKRTNAKGTTPKHDTCDRLDDLIALQSAARDALALARLALLRTLIDEVTKDLPRRKRERRVIAFNDMLTNLNGALHDKRYPWLSRSLRQRFPAALIDEFQDTDPLQFAIFDKIYGDGQSALFLVGDPKQAIYSFRNADLYTYLAARDKAKARYTLDRNQRSTIGLIKSVNALFGTNARAFMLDGLDYQRFTDEARTRDPLIDRSVDYPDDHADDRSDDRSHGRSEDHSDASKADLRVWMLPTAPFLPRAQVRTLAVQATAAEVGRLLDESNAGRITIGERKLQAADIAILVRTHAQGNEMKRALAKLDIGSVELLQESVFASVDAQEVERLLMAIDEPSRIGLLRAALATEIMGCDAADIAALSADENKLQQRIEQLSAWRELWLRSGAGVMFRQAMADESISARMLSRSDGERRLTNLLHLGEELHKASQVHDSPEALLRWFAEQRRDGSAAEANQLRLESDQNLVQIATIHKSKGLEFPIVFCPFLWDGFYMERRTGLDGREYHGVAKSPGTAVIDFRPEAVGDDAIKAQVRLEDSAELLRLAYVAMTRAVHRCYLVGGVYSRTKDVTKPQTKESCMGLLNWLVAGNGETPESWWAEEKSPEEIGLAWTALAQACRPHIALTPIPDAPGRKITQELPRAESLVAMTPPKRIARPWSISSFSGLANGASNEAASVRQSADHDARVAAMSGNGGAGNADAPAAPVRLGPPPLELPPDDILRFPRGINAGDCIHAALERIDFADGPGSAGWTDAINRALVAFPQADSRAMNAASAAGAAGMANAAARTAQAAMMERMLGDLMTAELMPGFTLASVTRARRITELEFSLSAGDVSPSWLRQQLAKSGYDVPHLPHGSLDGYLKGFIDLVFQHEGRFWIVDWKSNHLGYTVADYDARAVGAAMAEHAYHLQHLIYTIALDRYLSHRMTGYRYEEHFGGVMYLFVRGVRPGWRNGDGTPAGVYRDRATAEVVEGIDRMLRGAVAGGQRKSA